MKAAADAEQARLDQLVARRAALAKESQLLLKDIEDSDARVREINQRTRAERPVEVLTGDKDVANQLVRLGFDTVSTVAAVDDPRKLVGGPINLTTARSLIDEVDSLLSKRGEVKEARDRYANMEVSHLLSRIELHDGPVILTTNLRKELDQAFVRRFHIVVDFPRPDAAARSAL